MRKRDPLPPPKSKASSEHLLEMASLRRSHELLRAENEELLEGQRLLEEARDNYAELYDWAPLALLTLASAGSIRSANLATAELLQRERSWLVGRAFSSLVDELDHPELSACLSDSGSRECKVNLILPTESLVPVQLARRSSLRRAGVIHVTLADARPHAHYLSRTGDARLPPQYRVLLVEDDTDTAETMRHLFEGKGYGVVTAGSVALAASVDLELVDAIVSDILLPDGLGTDLLRRLKQDRDLPSIAFSALTKASDVERATQAGFDVYLAKPVDFTHLLGALSTLLSTRPRLRDTDLARRREERALDRRR